MDSNFWNYRRPRPWTPTRTRTHDTSIRKSNASTTMPWNVLTDYQLVCVYIRGILIIPDREFNRELWSRLSGIVGPDEFSVSWGFWFRALSTQPALHGSNANSAVRTKKTFQKWFLLLSWAVFVCNKQCKILVLEKSGELGSLIKDSKCSNPSKKPIENVAYIEYRLGK